MNKNKKKIILTGGGTAGSVSPLLAIAEQLNGYDFLWLGTHDGIERNMVEKAEIKFQTIAAGKLRRYWSFKNLIDPFKILLAFFQSIFTILRQRPALVMSAGAFVSVPVVWAAWLLSVPVLIHQQDVRPGLANKLMAPFADKITVTFEKSLADYGEKAVWAGNPVRFQLKIPASSEGGKNHESRITNKLKKDLPVVLIVGGGTGAVGINKLVVDSLSELVKFCQVIHITGAGKFDSSKKENYFPFEFLNAKDMAEALQSSEVVVSRAGMGLATELSFFGKPTIFIPMPDSHQEENAHIFEKNKAAIVLNQKELTSHDFADNIKKLINNKGLQKELSRNIQKVIKTDAGDRMVEIIKNL